MVNKYYLTNTAREDLENILDYVSINLTNPESAIGLIELFENKFNNILLFPKSYSLIYDNRLLKMDLRKCYVKNCIIVYSINDKEGRIEVLRVIYHKKNFINQFDYL